LALLLGPILYSKIFIQNIIEDPRALAEGVVETFWRAYGKGGGPASVKLKQNRGPS
jgi:hypothetical protein